MATTYSFYGILDVNLQTEHRGWRRYFDNEYARIAKPSADAPRATLTVDVRIEEKAPSREPGDVRGTERFKGLFKFSYVIRGLDTDHVTIWFRSHWLDRVYMNAIGVYLQAQVLEPIIYAKLLERDVLLMHAGGVASDTKGFLLPAYGGTGKTTLSMSLMAAGYKLLGDDLQFVDLTSGIVHPYPRPLHIFTYNVQNLVGAKVPLKYSSAVYAKNVLRWVLERLLHREFLISTRIHADELYPGEVFAKAVPYTAVGFLRKTGPGVESVDITDDNVDELADGIAASADLNDSLAAILHGDPRLTAMIEREHRVLVALLRQFDRLLYVNTRQMDLSNPDELIRQLEAGTLRSSDR
ncbi:MULTISPECIES: hypothetical protein [unclassified Curtobacterium]|uniref:hypothetical protein n=1 Tax=unclassified Curtobacterium TaxID=257496 RepID=UPI000D92AC8D|nr:MULTISPECIES: hypothetical protein [unclassified Curtobacterium]PYY40830.1 hypothetical protein DEJ32_05550 [Curtobacterium sp. MCPF17_046]PYY50075.1 hypothetical protein DEI84_05220 [Curtobacterium sp. MCBD17_023]WIB14539.1 hypothetical protein DEJ34_10230 [Curtobacterium sp. MCPF17_050]